jgi:hypothetical protein
VFPEDVDVPLPVVELLWRPTAGLDEFDSSATLERLFTLSLLLDLDLTERTARLHDVTFRSGERWCTEAGGRAMSAVGSQPE